MALKGVVFWFLLGADIIRHVSCKCSGKTCPPQCECPGGVNVTCRNTDLTAIHILPISTQSLTIDRASIQKLSAGSFENCHDLVSIRVIENKVPLQIHNDTFEHVPQLTTLWLYKCKMDLANYSQIPLGVFDSLSALLELRVDQQHGYEVNATDYRPDLFNNKSNLHTLWLDGIEGARFPNATSGLTSLTRLFIYGNTKKLLNDTFISMGNAPVSTLHVRSGMLEYVEPDALAPLINLTVLDLSDNNGLGLKPQWNNETGWDILKNCPGLTTLYLNNISSVASLNVSVHALPSSDQANITELQLRYNRLTGINGDLSTQMPHLQKLYLDYNHLVPTEYNFSKLEKLDLLSMKKQNYEWRVSKRLEVVLPPQLKYISFEDAFCGAYDSRLNNITLTGGAPLIKELDFSQNFIKHLAGPFVFADGSNHTIRVLNLSFLHFSNMSNQFFGGTPEIRIVSIDMSHSDIGNQLREDMHGTFMAQFQDVQLKVINFTGSNIKFLFSNFFSRISTLQKIILRDNAIHTWEPLLDNMRHLTWLDLSQNSLSYLSAKAINHLDHLCEIRKVCDLSVNLSANPLEVRCYGLELLEWILLNKSMINLPSKNYYTYYKGTNIINISAINDKVRHLQIDCSSHIWIMATASTFALTIFLLFVAVVVFRHRWDIRYSCIQMFRTERPYAPLHEDPNYEFDAFVAHHSDDFLWVKHQLMVNLEHTIPRPLKLLTPDRDWLPGIGKDENIVKSIAASRKTIVVVSNNVLSDPWYDFTLQMTWLRGYDICQEVAVVIALEEIPLEEMSGSLARLRLSHGNREWIEWPHAVRDQQQFWKDLAMALTRPRDRPNRWRAGQTVNEGSYQASGRSFMA